MKRKICIYCTRVSKNVLNKKFKNYEIIFVDDGSTDRTYKEIKSIKDSKIKIFRHKENLGLSKALSTGFKNSSGKLIVSMDGDLQNDPKDIPRLIKELSKGYDVICSWRYNRKDSLLVKRVPSRIFNFMNRLFFNIGIHDSSCTLRAYKRNVVKNLRLKKGQHRIIPSILLKKGYKITEVKVNHNPRKKGKAKYNSPRRFIKGFFDLIKLRLS
jgi:glycosyltransferase involved in cell wall biosynthesis